MAENLTLENLIEKLSMENDTVLMSGMDVLYTHPDILFASFQIEKALQQSPFLVKHSYQTIQDYIERGLTVLSVYPDLDKDGLEYGSFAKLKVHPNFETPEIIEVSSVVVNPRNQKNGLGIRTVLEAMVLSESIFPESTVIAVVAEANTQSRNLFSKIGGTEISMPSIVTPELKGPKVVYDLTRISRELHRRLG